MAKKMTKQNYVDALALIQQNFELPKEVSETIEYNLKAYKNNKRDLTMADINDTIEFLVEETQKSFEEYLADLGDVEATQEQPKVENSTKEDKKTLPKKEDKNVTVVKHELVNM